MNELDGSLREPSRQPVVCNLHLQGLSGVQPLTNDRVRIVFAVQIERLVLCGIPCRSQRDDRRP